MWSFSVRFGFYKKKIIKPKFFKKKTETGSNRPVSVLFGRFFRAKTGSNRFGLVFPIWLGFLGFGSVFPVLAHIFRFGLVFPVWLGSGSVFPIWLGSGSVWLSFFRFFSVSVRFGFFSFLLIKPKPNRTGWFFKILIGLIGFFFFVFSIIFFPVFSV